MYNLNNPADQEKFRKALRNIRKIKNIKQEELANIVGKSRSQISNWETSNKGSSLPSIADLCTLCEKLDIPPNNLLGYDEPTDNDNSVASYLNMSTQAIHQLRKNPTMCMITDLLLSNNALQKEIILFEKLNEANETLFQKPALQKLRDTFGQYRQNRLFSELDLQSFMLSVKKAFPLHGVAKSYSLEQTIRLIISEGEQECIMQSYAYTDRVSEAEQYNKFIQFISEIIYDYEIDRIVSSISRKEISEQITKIVDKAIDEGITLSVRVFRERRKDIHQNDAVEN